MWLCQCDCGGQKVALGFDLTHGRTTSCGCKTFGRPSSRRVDLVGNRYGTLTVVSLNEERSKNGTLHWNCICDCGEKVVMSGGNLKTRNKTHRGCKLRDKPYNYIDITGRRFGRLIALSMVDGEGKNQQWLCKCDCGNLKTVSKAALLSGKTKSCGCLLEETRHNPKRITHGETKTKLYQKYRGMLGRCSPTYHGASNYYDRGIRVCDEWRGENGFLNFKKWSLENGFDETKPWTEMTLDRIDVNGNYEPSNCRWTDSKTQCNNMRTNIIIAYNGETKTLKQWSETLGLNYGMIRARHQRGWTVPELFAEPRSISHRVYK